ncbi:MAG: nitroreductase family protein [Vulcanimicrobiaceae bacterium]
MNAVADNLRELVIMTSYEKSGRLDVPIFLPENKGRGLVFVETTARAMILRSTGMSVDGDFDAISRAVANVMVADVRFEPLNPVRLHRCYPSARSMFPIEIHFVFSQGEKSFRLRYNAEHHALLIPQEAQEALAGGPCDVRLELVAALERIAPLYGELAPTLCMLEAGHVSYELCAALGEAGLEPRLQCAASPRLDFAETGLRNAFVAAQIYFDDVSVVSPDVHRFSDVVRIAVPQLTIKDESQVGKALDRLRCPPTAARPMANPARAGGNRIKDTSINTRSSGNTFTGIFGRPVSEDNADRLSAAIVDSYRSIRDFDGDPHLKLTLLRPQPNLDVHVLRVDAEPVSTTVKAGCNQLAIAYGTNYNIDLATIPIVAVLSAPFGLMLAQQSSWSYIRMLLEAGAVAQGIGNVAAQGGYFARPFKGAVEILLEKTFGINGQAFYTILLWKGGPPNPFFSLEPVS